MGTSKPIIFLLLLILGALCSEDSCPVKFQDRPKIASDQISIQSKSPSSTQTGDIDYSYAYKQDFGSTPYTALGINGFDLNPTEELGVQVVLAKNSRSQADFKISFKQDSTWKQLKLNFLSTSRPDIEIGSLVLANPIAADSYTLSYKFNNRNLASSALLKFKIFISGIDIGCTDNIIKLNLERTDVTSKGIDIVYSTRGSSTQIKLLALTLIIFDGLNPAFRFAEGVISQTYLQSAYATQLSPQGVSELRTYMIGITSFEVNSDSMISLNSQIDNSFSLSLGPSAADCKVNYISVSYLIISVFTDCGACLPYIINFNGKCVASCPIGYYVSNGKCVAKTCKAGYYLLNGDCTKCPKYSDIRECNNACPIGTKLYGEECIPICKYENEVYSYSGCVCAAGFFRINGQCRTCPVGTKYDYSKQSCVSVCGANSYFDLSSLSCKCDDGFSMIHGFCVKCPAGYIFDQSWGACHVPCRDNEYFNGQQCVCVNNYYLINGACRKCADDEVYNTAVGQCVYKCRFNQVWQANSCACIAGYYRIDGVCTQCRRDQVYEPSIKNCRDKCVSGQIWDNGKCQCIPGSYLVAGACQICPTGTLYNQVTMTCDQMCKQRYQNYVNGKCVCIQGTVLDSKGACIPKQCPQNSQYSAQSDTCVCIDGYYLSKKDGCCVKIPNCQPNSYFVAGKCICLDGYSLSGDNKCIKCEIDQYEVFNGQKCVCIDGYLKNSAGKCYKPEVIPTCDQHEYYNKYTKSCECDAGYTRVKGYCVYVPDCDDNEVWNGEDCVCKSGYSRNKDSGKCKKVEIPIPTCPYNSYFNGYKCVCKDKFFELEPGVCAICPPNMTWNGKKCAYSKDCWEGYKWDRQTQCCVPKAQECPPNSKWNGNSCQCKPGYFSFNGQCGQCNQGYQFDGESCVRVSYNITCPGANMLVVNGQCVCLPDYNLYGGNCIACSYPTVWNGWFCQGNNDGCFTVANSHINPVDRKCVCDTGYRPVQGTCLPIDVNSHGKYPKSNQRGGYDSWRKGSGSNQKWNDNSNWGGQGFGGRAGQSSSWDSTGSVIQAGTNYEFTNKLASNVPPVQTYPAPPPPQGYAYYMYDKNGQIVPYVPSNPQQYNPNIPFKQYVPIPQRAPGGEVITGVPTWANGAASIYPTPSVVPSVVPYQYYGQHDNKIARPSMPSSPTINSWTVSVNTNSNEWKDGHK